MPKVPTYSETYVKTNRLNTPNPTPDSFGVNVGRAMQGAGQTMQQAGDVFAKRALEIQDENDKTSAI